MCLVINKIDRLVLEVGFPSHQFTNHCISF